MTSPARTRPATIGPVVVQADGGSRGNPGPAGFGAVVFDAQSGAVVAERCGFLGRNTNNVAEYSGVIAGLLAAASLGARAVAVRLDSKLIVEQMNGRWKVKDAKIRPLAARVAELRGHFDPISFDWVPRERNKHADRLANLAMDQGVSGRLAAIAAGEPGAEPDSGESTVAGSGPVGEAAATGSPGTAVVAGSSGSPGTAVVAGSSGSPGTAVVAGSAVLAPTASVDGLTRIVIVRHGETTLGAAGRFAGQNDVPLTRRGRDQAVALADRLAVLRPAAVWTSPLDRCRATAKPIGWRTRAPVAAVDELTDGTLGAWAGLTPQEIAARWPGEFSAWRTDVEAAPPGGESYAAVRRRAAAVLDAVLAQHGGRTVVLVTHAVTAKMMLIQALDVPSAAVYRLRVDPASLSMISIDPAGETLVWTVNEVGHLPV